MIVENISKVVLNPEDIKNIITEHLKNKNIIRGNETPNVEFNTKIKHEGEDLMFPGYDIPVFEGCTVIINRN